MAHRGHPRAPKGPGPAARAPSSGAPPPPRSRPLLLLLLLLPLAARGAAGRSPEPGRLGPRAWVTRSPPSPSAGRVQPGGGEDRQARGTGSGAPGPAPGPREQGAPAASQGRRARAAPVAGAASPAQVSLISTSFVLKGDATHNQAMVHWTGENSSVSDLRAPPGLRPRPRGGPLLPDRPAAGLGVLGHLGTRVTSAAPLPASGHRLPEERTPRLTSGDIPTDFRDPEPPRGRPHWPPDLRLCWLGVLPGAPRALGGNPPASRCAWLALRCAPRPRAAPRGVLGFGSRTLRTPVRPEPPLWHLLERQDFPGRPGTAFRGHPSPAGPAARGTWARRDPRTHRAGRQTALQTRS